VDGMRAISSAEELVIIAKTTIDRVTKMDANQPIDVGEKIHIDTITTLAIEMVGIMDIVAVEDIDSTLQC
jgi:hypothetical protein